VGCFLLNAEGEVHGLLLKDDRIGRLSRNAEGLAAILVANASVPLGGKELTTPHGTIILTCETGTLAADLRPVGRGS
jgi:hypothetical protein